jgi:hypothetical protein
MVFLGIHIMMLVITSDFNAIRLIRRVFLFGESFLNEINVASFGFINYKLFKLFRYDIIGFLYIATNQFLMNRI